MLPKDIENKVKSLYPDTAAQQVAFAIYENLKISGTVTGTDQLFRSMLILAESDLKELIRLGDNY